jgi:hypothetical protein
MGIAAQIGDTAHLWEMRLEVGKKAHCGAPIETMDRGEPPEASFKGLHQLRGVCRWERGHTISDPWLPGREQVSRFFPALGRTAICPARDGAIPYAEAGSW